LIKRVDDDQGGLGGAAHLGEERLLAGVGEIDVLQHSHRSKVLAASLPTTNAGTGLTT